MKGGHLIIIENSFSSPCGCCFSSALGPSVGGVNDEYVMAALDRMSGILRRAKVGGIVRRKRVEYGRQSNPRFI
jgi:hypothetical protein